MYEILANDDIALDGLNFDAKVRRESVDSVDRFQGHVAGMDAFARGLEVAHVLHEDDALKSFIEERYASYQDGIGATIVNQEADLETLADHAREMSAVDIASARQEKLKEKLNQYILEH